MDTTNDKALPFVNMNGDSASTLKMQYRDAHIALDDAINIVRLSAPHGRNYQADHCEYSEARKEFDTMMTSLNDMKARMLTFYLHVEKAGK